MKRPGPGLFGMAVLLLALGACSSNPTAPSAGDGGSAGDAAGAGNEGGSGPALAECEEGPYPTTEPRPVTIGHVTAQLVDEQGEPVAPGLVQLCGKDLCFDVAVGQSGKLDKALNQELDAPALKLGDGRGFGKLSVPLEAGDSDLGTLVVTSLPAFEEGAPLRPGERVSSGGVTLRLSDDARVEIDELSYEDEAEWGLRAARVTDEARASLGLSDFGAVYVLAPLQTRICPSPELELDNDAGFPAGAELELFVLGLDVLEEFAPYGEWFKTGEGRVSDDGETLVFPDGVPVLTALGVREKP